MPGRAGIVCVLIFTVASALAQPATGPSHLELGKAAIDARDPAAAIAHFERDHSKAARAWLAVALMLESRSPSDRYVERAFDAAARARAHQPDRVRARTELTAAMRPGDMVIAFLVGERDAYAWAFDRDVMVGYRLPPPREIAVAVERVNSYLAQQDRAGAQRIADDLMPALLGPAADRIPALTRVIFVMDGPLRRLPIGTLPVGDNRRRLAERLAVAVVDDAGLADEIARASAEPQRSSWPTTAVAAAAIVVGMLLLAAVAALRRRSSVA